MSATELFVRQTIGILAYSMPAAFLITLFAWFGLRGAHTGTPTTWAALRALAACLIGCFLYAVIRFDSPAEFQEKGMTGVIFISFVGSIAMMLILPGKGKPKTEGH